MIASAVISFFLLGDSWDGNNKMMLARVLEESEGYQAEISTDRKEGPNLVYEYI